MAIEIVCRCGWEIESNDTTTAIDAAIKHKETCPNEKQAWAEGDQP